MVAASVPVTVIMPALFRLDVFQLSPGDSAGSVAGVMDPLRPPVNKVNVLPP